MVYPCRCALDKLVSLVSGGAPAAPMSHAMGNDKPEKVVCSKADFPARVAALYAQEHGFTNGACVLEGGTDDIESAYRQIGCALPRYTVVAVWHPDRRETLFSTLRGFNFGLTSAVHSFNRYPRMLVRAMRLVHAWNGCAYYDDFCTVEPTFARGSGQRALLHMAELLRIPFAAAKHVPMAPRFVFLGVEACLGAFWPDGVVTLGVTEERCWRIADTLDLHIGSRSMFSGEAASAGGRLGFSTSWAAGRFGRAIMQPLYRRAGARESHVGPGLLEALLFFASVLRRRGGLPPRRYRLRSAGRPTVRVWTDAAWEAGHGSVAYVVCFPGEWEVLPGGQRRFRARRYVHGFADAPADIMARFYERKQYIGQLELLAAVAVYYSLPELRGRRCIHWIDNTSAIAALIKGYSGAPDSCRILHAFAAFGLGLEVASWFLWVPSKANIADLPSRGELGLLEELGSEERPFVIPPFAAWDRPAAEWVDLAVARGGEAAPAAARPGRVAIGNIRFRGKPRPGDVRVDRRSASPLQNCFAMRGASRAQVCDAFGSLLCAPCEDDDAPQRIARAARMPARALEAEACASGAQAGRLEALETLARRVATGEDVRLLCWCWPRQCHATEIAVRVRERAEELGARARRRRVR